MSLFADYYKEREGVDTLETEGGFATYILRKADCYIMDIYVRPELRKSGLATKLADEIVAKAKAAGIKILTGSVDSRSPTAPQSAAVLCAYGMVPCRQSEFMVYFKKELS